MRRREFVALLGVTAGWPLAARAQPAIGQAGKMPRIGILMPGSSVSSEATLKPFYQGLHELGYFEGQNLAIERREAEWKSDRLQELAGELVRQKVDMIVAWMAKADVHLIGIRPGSMTTWQALKRLSPSTTSKSWNRACYFFARSIM